MDRFAWSLLAVVLMLAFTACSRPSRQSCEVACNRIRTFAKAEFDSRTQDLPEDQRREGWLEAVPAFNEIAKGCIAACMEGGSQDLVDCLKNADSDPEWRACIETRRR